MLLSRLSEDDGGKDDIDALQILRFRSVGNLIIILTVRVYDEAVTQDVIA